MNLQKTADEIWLFGSHARGEIDEGSDVDVLVVYDERELSNELTASLIDRYGENVDLSHYSYAGLAKLVDQRALFAWHLRREGVPVFHRKGRLEGMLQDMKPYDAHIRDLGVLTMVFDDAVASLRNGWASSFDLGVVGTVIRNTGIIMHDLFGSWDFSPKAPIRLAFVTGAPSLPIDSELYAHLCSCRRASERGRSVDDLESLGWDQWSPRLKQVRQWLSDCFDCANK